MNTISTQIKRFYLEHYQRRLTLRLLAAKEELSMLEALWVGPSSGDLPLQEALIDQRLRVETLMDESKRVAEQLVDLNVEPIVAG